jgi:hypothetical protein
VRTRVTEAGRLYEFRLDTRLDPQSLSLVTPHAQRTRGDGRGLVRASMNATRALVVSIETRDDGHAGEYGFMYTDPGGDSGDLERVRRDSQHEEHIDARWVRWKYDLD